MIAQIVTELPDKEGRVTPRDAPGIISLLRSLVCHNPERLRLFAERKAIIHSGLSRYELDLRIVARQMSQQVKHVFGIRVDGARNFFGGLFPISSEFLNHLFLKLQQSG